MGTITVKDIQGVGSFGGCFSISTFLIMDSITSSTLALRSYAMGRVGCNRLYNVVSIEPDLVAFIFPNPGKFSV